MAFRSAWMCLVGATVLLACSPAPTPVVDAGPDLCKAITGAGTSHGATIDADERWAEAGNPHLIPVDLVLKAGATLRLDPCVVVRIGDGKTFTVSGIVEAQGTQIKPVLIERSDATKAWGSLRGIGGQLRLTHTTVKGGGNPLNAAADVAAMIDMSGDQTMPTQNSFLADNVSLLDSASQGLLMREGAGFAPASVELIIEGSASYPMQIWSRSAGTIPTGAYVGNAKDEIVLTASGGNEAINEDTTFHDRGVPYRVGSALSLGTLTVAKMTGLATLTIEPGVTLKFKKGGVMHIEPFSGIDAARGALIAVGTSAKPITFTSAEASPVAGDWLGLSYGKAAHASNQLEFARVEYAGGVSSAGSSACPYPGMGNPEAAIRLIGDAEPVGAFVKNTTVFKSAKHGIDRGWRGTASFDFLATNTFTDVPGCNQTFPTPLMGGCPMPVPCPK